MKKPPTVPAAETVGSPKGISKKVKIYAAGLLTGSVRGITHKQAAGWETALFEAVRDIIAKVYTPRRQSPSENFSSFFGQN